MKLMTTSMKPGGTQSQVALHVMINQLTRSTRPAAEKRRNCVMNEVPADLSVNTDSQKLATVLGTLIQSIMGQTTDACIRISAKEYSDVTLVHIKDNKRICSESFNSHLEEAQEIAGKIGGTVFVNNYRDGSTTIAVSILNHRMESISLSTAV